MLEAENLPGMPGALHCVNRGGFRAGVSRTLSSPATILWIDFHRLPSMPRSSEPSQLNMTPLHQTHLDAGAKMVDFSGWHMPLHYGSQIEEHQRVRSACGLFDVSHMAAVDVNGEQAEDFLRLLLANDVGRLQDGAAQYSLMLEESGGVQFIDEIEEHDAILTRPERCGK